MNTSAYTAQSALVTALTNNAGLTGVPVYDGGITGQVPEEWVVVSGEVENGQQDYELSALAAKMERYDLRIEVFTQYATDEWGMVRDRLRTLAAAVADVVHTNSTLTGSVMLASLGRFRIEEAVYEGTRQGLMTLWVTCEAWLTTA